MQFNTSQRELTLKVVYYGPALSGKTTNLQALHSILDPVARGHLTTLDTKGDRTLFFDLLPIQFRARSGVHVKFKLYTVPGQVIHQSTRRIVLSGTDGVVFVADSQRKKTAENNDSFKNMYDNLRANGISPEQVPMVIQFNKRDLPEVRTDQEIAAIGARGKEPVFTAVATRGEGVVETLRGIMLVLFKSLEASHGFSSKFGVSEREFMNSIFRSIRDQEVGGVKGVSA